MTKKTKIRILEAARVLFNEEGESNVAMVDIAAVLDISPGNLYYHYRGKDELIPVLFDFFEEELKEVLVVPLDSLTVVDDHWAYCYMLLELLHRYRFIYGLDILRFDSSMFRRSERLRRLLIKQLGVLMRQLYRSLAARSEPQLLALDLHFEQTDMDVLAENCSLFIFSWMGSLAVGMEPRQSKLFLHEGVYRVFFQLGTLVENNHAYLSLCKELHQQIKAEV